MPLAKNKYEYKVKTLKKNKQPVNKNKLQVMAQLKI